MLRRSRTDGTSPRSTVGRLGRTPSVNVNVSLLHELRGTEHARARGVENALGVGGLDGGGGDVSDMVREEAAGGRAALAVPRRACRRLVVGGRRGDRRVPLAREEFSRAESAVSDLPRSGVRSGVPRGPCVAVRGACFRRSSSLLLSVLIARQRQRLSCELPDRVTVARPCPPGVQRVGPHRESVCSPAAKSNLSPRTSIYSILHSSEFRSASDSSPGLRSATGTYSARHDDNTTTYRRGMVSHKLRTHEPAARKARRKSARRKGTTQHLTQHGFRAASTMRP